MKQMMKYNTVQIETIKQLLNGMVVTGIDNCKRIAMIASILEDPEKENENGTKEE